jgi:hypothetical protein
LVTGSAGNTYAAGYSGTLCPAPHSGEGTSAMMWQGFGFLLGKALAFSFGDCRQGFGF